MLAMRPQTQILTELVESRSTTPPHTPTSSISEHSAGHIDTKRHSSHNSSAGENDGDEEDVFQEQLLEDKEEAGCVVS